MFLHLREDEAANGCENAKKHADSRLQGVVASYHAASECAITV